MFSTLKQNSIFYIFDKNINPNIKIGKVVNISVNPQNYGLANQEIDITIDVNGDTYEFKKKLCEMVCINHNSTCKTAKGYGVPLKTLEK